MKCEICQKEINKRTSAQNRSLHLWFSQLADALSEAGFDVQTTLKEGIKVPWSATMVKELIWRPLQKLYLKERSTTKLKTTDIDKLYDIINLEIGTRTGIDVPLFPSIEQMIDYEENK